VTDLKIIRVRGEPLRAALQELAELRIQVFREYPYLYEGSLDYERRYLESYENAEESCLVVAQHGERVVGAATAVPLLAHGEEVAPALKAAGFDPKEVFYFGESVLLSAYRGRGVGHAFFDAREQAAREAGFRMATFCAVERPAGHPQRPQDYVGHERFWQKRGYRRRPDIVAQFSWRDLGEPQETAKPMVFWVRELGK
jgi:GNAT superfamily N-acetyltransferase